MNSAGRVEIGQDAPDRPRHEEDVLGPVGLEPVVHGCLIPQVELLAAGGEEVLETVGLETPDKGGPHEAAVSRHENFEPHGPFLDFPSPCYRGNPSHRRRGWREPRRPYPDIRDSAMNSQTSAATRNSQTSAASRSACSNLVTLKGVTRGSLRIASTNVARLNRAGVVEAGQTQLSCVGCRRNVPGCVT